MHEKQMHIVAEERVRFVCTLCEMSVETEGLERIMNGVARVVRVGGINGQNV